MPISPRYVGTPGGQIGSRFSASLTASRLADTGISLPRGGRIRLIGSVADGSHFALLVPVALLSTLTAKAPGDDLTHTAPFGAGSALVNFGRTSGGHLLMGSAMSGGVRRFMRFMRLWTMLALLLPLLAGLTVTTLPLSARAADDRVNPLAELRSPKERDLKEIIAAEDKRRLRIRLAEERLAKLQEQERRESYEYYTLWTNCEHVGINVYVQDGKAIGLTQESIEVAARSRLRSMRLYGAPSEPVSGILHIDVLVSPQNHAFTYQIWFAKYQTDIIAGTTFRSPAGWSKWVFGGASDANGIRHGISSYLDIFVDDYLRVNEALLQGEVWHLGCGVLAGGSAI